MGYRWMVQSVQFVTRPDHWDWVQRIVEKATLSGDRDLATSSNLARVVVPDAKRSVLRRHPPTAILYLSHITQWCTPSLLEQQVYWNFKCLAGAASALCLLVASTASCSDSTTLCIHPSRSQMRPRDKQLEGWPALLYLSSRDAGWLGTRREKLRMRCSSCRYRAACFAENDRGL